MAPGVPTRLRAAGVIALVVGACGSAAFTLYAGRQNAHYWLTAIFVVWGLSPFAALAVAHFRSSRWPVMTRTALYSVMVAVTVGSLAIYGLNALMPPKSQRAFIFVVVPPLSWLVIVVVLSTVAFMSRRLAPRP